MGHQIMLKKLELYGVCKSSLKWFISYLKAKDEFQVQLGGRSFETNIYFCVSWFCTTAHCGHLERINHNERLLLLIDTA